MAVLPVYGLLELFIDSEEEGGPFFVLQRKGPDHPNSAFRHRLTLFGGSEIREIDATVALKIRLHQQFEAEIAETLLDKARFRKTVDYPTGTIGFFECRLKGTLADWRTRLQAREGHAEFLRAYEVRQLMLCENLFLPGIAAHLHSVV